MSVLQTIDLKKYYGTEPNITRALDGVNFSVEDGEFVACGLTNLVNIFFPEVLALSGGVANQGDALLLPLRERVRERSFGSRYAVSHTRIELCTLGYRAGVIGAAMLARE